MAHAPKSANDMSWIASPTSTRTVATVFRFSCSEKPAVVPWTPMEARSLRTKIRVTIRGLIMERWSPSTARMMRARIM